MNDGIVQETDDSCIKNKRGPRSRRDNVQSVDGGPRVLHQVTTPTPLKSRCVSVQIARKKPSSNSGMNTGRLDEMAQNQDMLLEDRWLREKEEALPLLKVKALRKSAAYTATTAAEVDGFHPRVPLDL